MPSKGWLPTTGWVSRQNYYPILAVVQSISLFRKVTSMSLYNRMRRRWERYFGTDLNRFSRGVNKDKHGVHEGIKVPVVPKNALLKDIF